MCLRFRRRRKAEPEEGRCRAIGQGGYASVKALIGVFVLGAMVKVGSPQFSTLGQLNRVDRLVTSALESAKLRAIAEDRCYQIYFNGVARTLEVMSKRTETPCGITGYATEGDARPLDRNDGIAVEVSGQAVFDTWGKATKATIKLTAPNGFSRTIVVNPDGRIERG